MACSTASESTVLNLPDFVWSDRFLQPRKISSSGNCTVISCALTFRSKILEWLLRHYGSVQSHKVYVFGLDYATRSSVRLWNHSLKEAMHNVLAHFCETTNHNRHPNDWNCFEYVIWALRSKIWQNFWFTQIFAQNICYWSYRITRSELRKIWQCTFLN